MCDTSKLLRSLLLEQSSAIANERVSAFTDVATERIVVKDSFYLPRIENGTKLGNWQYRGYSTVLSEAHEFAESDAETLRTFAHQVLWAFEYNKLIIKYRKLLRLIWAKKVEPPKLFFSYRFSFKSQGKVTEETNLVCLILALDEKEHNSVCGTFTRVLENAFIKQARKQNTLFARKLTLSDDYHLERQDRARYEDSRFDVLDNYKKRR